MNWNHKTCSVGCYRVTDSSLQIDLQWTCLSALNHHLWHLNVSCIPDWLSWMHYYLTLVVHTIGFPVNWVVNSDTLCELWESVRLWQNHVSHLSPPSERMSSCSRTNTFSTREMTNILSWYQLYFSFILFCNIVCVSMVVYSRDYL